MSETDPKYGRPIVIVISRNIDPKVFKDEEASCAPFMNSEDHP
ncbi:hypothetical protein [Brevibacillus dissolubilis]|nr:hypothetical protein [Brevibacillus dissolubilis]